MACADNPANMVQIECGHCCLCTNCAFRCIVEVGFFPTRAVPVCNSPVAERHRHNCSCQVAETFSGLDISMSQDRRCPACRTTMLFPLSVKGAQQEITPALAKAALDFAKAKGRGVGGEKDGVIQALKGIFYLLPASELPGWVDVLKAVAVRAAVGCLLLFFGAA